MKRSYQVLILFLICLCVFFVHLDAAFPDLMEMRNFITAREMITEGNWWFTTLNLEPRLEKPPLPTWLTAWSVLLLGDFDNLYALRLPGAISASLMVFFFYGLLRELSTEKYLPFIGAVVLATSVLVVQIGRTNSWDIYTHSFLVGSLWQFMVGIKRQQLLPIIFSMLLMGLSIFSKGPVSLYALWIPFLIALGVGNRALLQKHWGKLLFILLGGLIIGFAWNFYMYLFQQEATEYVINKETNSWVNRHVKSPIFYLNFPIFIGIWIPLLIPFFFYKYARTKTESFKQYQFVLVWLIAIVVLLSLIPTKKERYVLPALIPMCMAVAYIINGIYQGIVKNKLAKYDILILRFSFYLIAGASVVGPVVMFILFRDTISLTTILGFSTITLLALFFIVRFLKRNYRHLIILPIGVVCLLCLFAIPNLIQWSYGYDEFNSLAEIQKIEELEELSFYTENMHTDPKLCWLIGKPTQLVSTVNFDKPDQFPLVAVTVNSIGSLYEYSDLKKVTYKYFGQYDYFRKKSKWRANVYLIEWKGENE